MADDTYDGGGYAYVQQNTAAGAGIADVSLQCESDGTWYSAGSPVCDFGTKTTGTYAVGRFLDTSGYTLNGWLERSTDGGQTWYTVSGVHSLTSASLSVAQWVQTDDYYDGTSGTWPGEYLARACFQFTSWSGAAVHCSPAI